AHRGAARRSRRRGRTFGNLPARRFRLRRLLRLLRDLVGPVGNRSAQRRALEGRLRRFAEAGTGVRRALVISVAGHGRNMGRVTDNEKGQDRERGEPDRKARKKKKGGAIIRTAL